MELTRKCACGCGASLQDLRADAVYASEACSKRYRREHSADIDRTGARGGNVRSVAEARALQEGEKDKDHWSGFIDLQIEHTLVSTGTCHANDLEDLGVPPAHCNLIGTRMARFRNKGYMEPTTERRKVTHSAANGRRNPVYRITPKGWKELKTLVGVGGGDAPAPPVSVVASRRNSLHSGESRVEGRGEPGMPGTSAAVKTFDPASPESTAGVGSDNREGSAGLHIASTLDRPGADSVRAETSGARSSLAADPGGGSSAGSTLPGRQLPAEEARPAFESLTLLPEPESPKLLDHDTPRAA